MTDMVFVLMMVGIVMATFKAIIKETEAFSKDMMTMIMEDEGRD